MNLGKLRSMQRFLTKNVPKRMNSHHCSKIAYFLNKLQYSILIESFLRKYILVLNFQAQMPNVVFLTSSCQNGHVFLALFSVLLEIFDIDFVYLHECKIKNITINILSSHFKKIKTKKMVLRMLKMPIKLFLLILIKENTTLR